YPPHSLRRRGAPARGPCGALASSDGHLARPRSSSPPDLSHRCNRLDRLARQSAQSVLARRYRANRIREKVPWFLDQVERLKVIRLKVLQGRFDDFKDVMAL